MVALNWEVELGERSGKTTPPLESTEPDYCRAGALDRIMWQAHAPWVKHVSLKNQVEKY
jgi:hypothetical protein